MRIKSFNRLLCILLSAAAAASCLHGCTVAENSQGYVMAAYSRIISKSEDAVCWVTNDNIWVTNNNINFYIEQDGQIKSKEDYNIDADPYYDSPFISGDYLYYIGGTYTYDTHDIYIARIDYTEEEPQVEQLTENYRDIDSFVICGNTLFFTGTQNIDFNLYMKKLSDDKEEVLIEGGPSKFCTNGEKIIAKNKIYDISTKTVEELYDVEELNENESLSTLGVWDNYYYCYYIGYSSDGYPDNYYTVLQINLDDYSAEQICEIPWGMTYPKLCDDKILFADQELGCSTVGFYYYDIPTGEVVTVIESDNSSERYIDDNDELVAMDYILYDNMYYFHYGKDVITRVNIDTKQEEVFARIYGATEDGYEYLYVWLSPEEYETTR